MLANILIGVGELLILGTSLVFMVSTIRLYVSAVKETIWGNKDGVATGIAVIGTFLLGLLLVEVGRLLG